MAHAVSFAKSHHCYKVLLLSSVDRKSAHEFYIAPGFVPDDKLGFVLGDETLKKIEGVTALFAGVNATKVHKQYDCFFVNILSFSRLLVFIEKTPPALCNPLLLSRLLIMLIFVK